MMSRNHSSDLICKLGQSESRNFGTTFERSADPQGLFGRQFHNSADECWLARTNESALITFFRNTLQVIKTDPRQLELEEAERKALVEQLRRTYARIADAILWSVLACILAAVALLPVVGLFAALILPAV
jgi:hypothetical protein